MSYKNFNAAVYCPVENLMAIDDMDDFSERFAFIEKHIEVGKVYLETYRSGTLIQREKIEKIIAFFKDRGIAVSGGITTDIPTKGDGGFDSFCYTDPENRKFLAHVAGFTASLFDEIILDDFFFTNCKCERCIDEKGNRSWSEFRVALLKEISENVIVGPARTMNPNVKMIIKYPNWYEHYQEAGYNLKDEPGIFDGLYTGTETRNPTYTQQHLPKYLSYFNMRYLENVAPRRNGGGWFDPYECTYNLTSYAEQAYLTLFAKAREATLFSLGSLLEEQFSLFVPVAGQVFSDMDKHLSELGNPVGTACYLPYHSHGEDYIHNYLGMLGIPLEPFPDYPESALHIFLAEGAAHDPDIVEKMKHSLKRGAHIIVTSGFVKAVQQQFYEFANITYTGRKASVSKYAYSINGGVSFGGCEASHTGIIIPQLEYPTNDTWELIGAFGEDNSFPILLKTNYGAGKLFVLTIPDDWGDLYHLPRTLLKMIREVFSDSRIKLDAASKHALFAYDNDTFILRSFQPFYDRVSLEIAGENVVLMDRVKNKKIEGITVSGKTHFEFISAPGTNRIFKIG